MGIPALAALAIWRLGERMGAARRWAAAGVFAPVALLGLAVFIVDRQYGCALSYGSRNCTFDALGSLSLAVLSGFLAWLFLRARDRLDHVDTALMLLFTAAWAGAGLSTSLLPLIVSLNVLVYVGNRLLNRRGFRVRYLLMRDDYDDGSGPR